MRYVPTYSETIKVSVLKCRELLSLKVYFTVIQYPQVFIEFNRQKWSTLLVQAGG